MLYIRKLIQNDIAYINYIQNIYKIQIIFARNSERTVTELANSEILKVKHEIIENDQKLLRAQWSYP